MSQIIRVTDGEASRLTEIGELTALAYLADGLVGQAHPYLPQLKDAAARARDAVLLCSAGGDDGTGAMEGSVTVVAAGTPFSELAQEGEYELRMLAVSPLYRGRGIGESLARAGMDVAAEAGATRVVLSTMESMESAHRLYERLGFVREPSFDWVVHDSDDTAECDKTCESGYRGEPTCAVGGVRLIGYSWIPTAP